MDLAVGENEELISTHPTDTMKTPDTVGKVRK